MRRGRRIGARTLNKVGAIHGGGVVADEDLADARGRGLNVRPGEAIALDFDGFHDAFLCGGPAMLANRSRSVLDQRRQGGGTCEVRRAYSVDEGEAHHRLRRHRATTDYDRLETQALDRFKARPLESRRGRRKDARSDDATLSIDRELNIRIAAQASRAAAELR